MEMTKEIKLRELTSKDIFPACAIINKVGISEFKGLLENDDILKLANAKNKSKDDAIAQVGISIMLGIVDVLTRNIPKIQNELYSFLSNLTDLSRKELEDLPIAEFIELLVSIKNLDSFADFLSVVSKLLK